MGDDREIKQAIVRKYDEEARELDTPAWLEAGEDVRVPERGAAHYFVARKVKQALALCGSSIPATADVLEIGCGLGQMTALLAKHCARLTAVDISPECVRIAEKRMRAYGIEHVTFLDDDAESLAKLPDESFDYLFSFSTVRFCPRPGEAMAAMRRKLRPGGVAVVDFPNRHSPWHALLKPLLGIAPHIHDRLYTKKEAVALFESSGFAVEQAVCFLFTSRRLPAPLLPFFAAADFLLERLPLFPRLAGIVMVKGIRP